jgi:hypothetical protein
MDYFCNKLKEDIEYIMERPLDPHDTAPLMSESSFSFKEDESSYYIESLAQAPSDAGVGGWGRRKYL